MESVKRILKGEIIGRNTRAVCLNSDQIVVGKIINETKNIIEVETKKTRKKLVKKNYTFEFACGKKIISIDGKHLNKRPEDRIKTKLRW